MRQTARKRQRVSAPKLPVLFSDLLSALVLLIGEETYWAIDAADVIERITGSCSGFSGTNVGAMFRDADARCRSIACGARANADELEKHGNRSCLRPSFGAEPACQWLFGNALDGTASKAKAFRRRFLPAAPVAIEARTSVSAPKLLATVKSA